MIPSSIRLRRAMSEPLRQERVVNGFENGGVPDGRPPVPADSRINQLYREEQRPLSIRESLALIVRSWQFIRPHRRLLALKLALAMGSLSFFLLTPWPMKIVIDNVINGHP